MSHPTPTRYSPYPLPSPPGPSSPSSSSSSPLVSLTYPQDPTPPPLSQQPLSSFPTPAALTDLLTAYLTSLHPSKRAKALLSRSFLNLIHNILASPQSTSISDAQTRFWARRQFTLVPGPGGELRVCHHASSLPLAPAESIWRIVTEAHARVGHVGRDRTVREVQKEWAGVPKEVVGRYVKACPGCRGVRKVGGVRGLSVPGAAAGGERMRTRELAQEEEDELLQDEGMQMQVESYSHSHTPGGQAYENEQPAHLSIYSNKSSSSNSYYTPPSASSHSHYPQYEPGNAYPHPPAPHIATQYQQGPPASHLHPFSPASHPQSLYTTTSTLTTKPPSPSSHPPGLLVAAAAAGGGGGGAGGSPHASERSAHSSSSLVDGPAQINKGSSPLDILAAVATDSPPQGPRSAVPFSATSSSSAGPWSASTLPTSAVTPVSAVSAGSASGITAAKSVGKQPAAPLPPPTLPFTSSLASPDLDRRAYEPGAGKARSNGQDVRYSMSAGPSSGPSAGPSGYSAGPSAGPSGYSAGPSGYSAGPSSSYSAGPSAGPSSYSAGPSSYGVARFMGPGRRSSSFSRPTHAPAPAPAQTAQKLTHRLPHFFQLLSTSPHIRLPTDPPAPLRSPPYGPTILPSLPSLNLPHGPSPSAHRRPVAEGSGRVGLPSHLRRVGEEEERQGREREERERHRREREMLAAAAAMGARESTSAAVGAPGEGLPPTGVDGHAETSTVEGKGKAPETENRLVPLSGMASSSASTSATAAAHGPGEEGWNSCNPLLPRNAWEPRVGRE